MKKIVFFLLLAACGKDPEDSKKAAMNFALSAEWENVKKIECQRYDGDSNDYVSCNVFHGDKEVDLVECPASWSCNENCRLGAVKSRR